MKDLGFETLDPNDLEIDPVNERKTDVKPQKGDNSLVNSVKSKGVIEPVVVREKGGKHYVVAGQRRTLAAQIAGVREIKARVMEMTDAEARVISITENAETFNKNVSAEDRARAVAELRDNEEWSQTKIAEELGVTQPTISRWLEPAHPDWAGTPIDPDEDGDLTANEIPNKSLKIIRKNSNTKDERVELAEFTKENNIKVSLVERADNRSSTPNEFRRNLERIAEEQKEGKSVVRTSVRFTDDTAEGIREIMKQYGKSDDEVIEELTKRGLKSLDMTDPS